MTNETTDNFWAAFAEPQPDPIKQFYRLYYDDAGFPLFYSTEDKPGNYIEIDQETYNKSSSKVRVVNRKLTVVDRTQALTKLVPGSVGVPCAPSDVCIVVEDTEPHTKWSLK